MNLPYKWVINHTSDKNLHIFCKIKISFGVPHFVIIDTMDFWQNGNQRVNQLWALIAYLQPPTEMSIYIREINVNIFHLYNIDIYYKLF